MERNEERDIMENMEIERKKNLIISNSMISESISFYLSFVRSFGNEKTNYYFSLFHLNCNSKEGKKEKNGNGQGFVDEFFLQYTIVHTHTNHNQP